MKFYTFAYFISCRMQDDESTSEFSFTSSLMEALDGQGKKVHFADASKH